MAVEIKVPDMGESVIEATVSRWLKQEGEPVKAGEPLVELETDKINLEVGAQQSGVLEKITRQPGDTVAVGDVLGLVGAGTGQPADAKSPPAEKQPAEAKPAAVDKGEASSGSGQPAEKTAEKPAAAVVDEVKGQAGQGAAGAAQSGAGDLQSAGIINASPVAMRMAQDLGIDLRKVSPSGSGGRITREDVTAYVEKGVKGAGAATAAGAAQGGAGTAQGGAAGQSAGVSASAGASAPSGVSTGTQSGVSGSASSAAPAGAAAGIGGYAQGSSPTSDSGGPVKRIRMTRRRQTIAKRLVEAQQTAAMLTTFNEIDMSKVMELRKRRRESFKERYGVDLGFMSFFVKAVIGALKAFPNLNAEMANGPQGDEIVQKQYYDIGIAVGNEEGLVVPVIRGADRLNFAGVEKAVRELAEKARSGMLTLDELRGGTFTITNGGVYGSLLSTPILNPPQVGILGMHAIKERPVVVDGEIIIRPMMYVALSYDHRIVDGSEAVRFLVRVKELVEDPEALLFG